MISDILDSQESIFEIIDNVESDNLPDSQESFSDFWNTKVDCRLYPELDFVTSTSLNEDFNTGTADSHPSQPSTSRSSYANVAKSEVTPQEFCMTPIQSLTQLQQENDINSSSTNKFSGYPGEYEFSINYIKRDETAAQSVHYIHSPSLSKLFVQTNEICPIRFKCKRNPPIGCQVRVIMYFKNSKYASECVKPCLLHRETCNSTDCLLQTSEPDAIYQVAQDGQHSICFPYVRSIESGFEYHTIRLQFNCLSSCKSGVNRRATALVFFLETPCGEILGRHFVDICICTRPVRDCLREEKKQAPKQDKKVLKRSNSNSLNSSDDNSSKTKRESDTNELFVMHIRGRKKYEKLLSIKQAFDLEELVSEEQRQEYFQKEQVMDG